MLRYQEQLFDFERLVKDGRAANWDSYWLNVHPQLAGRYEEFAGEAPAG